MNKTLFVLTVDTEEEWDWFGELPRSPFSTENIKQIPEFQGICNSMGLSPTYLLDYAVIDNPINVDIFRHYLDEGLCDIGAHLHPWCTPPVIEEINAANSHAINLPLELFESKMRNLTDRLECELGRHPFSFRAGRWGMNGQQLKVLASLGYRVDTSVKPFFTDTYFSYSEAITRPYWPSFDQFLTNDPSQNSILEIPASGGFTHPAFELQEKIYKFLSRSPQNRLRGIGILWKLNLMRKVSISPEGQEISNICRCIDACIKRKDPVINMYLHSSDLLPGCGTPYVKNNDDKSQFLDCLRKTIEYVKVRHDVVFTTLREVPELLKRETTQ